MKLHHQYWPPLFTKEHRLLFNTPESKEDEKLPDENVQESSQKKLKYSEKKMSKILPGVFAAAGIGIVGYKTAQWNAEANRNAVDKQGIANQVEGQRQADARLGAILHSDSPVITEAIRSYMISKGIDEQVLRNPTNMTPVDKDKVRKIFEADLSTTLVELGTNDEWTKFFATGVLPGHLNWFESGLNAQQQLDLKIVFIREYATDLALHLPGDKIDHDSDPSTPDDYENRDKRLLARFVSVEPDGTGTPPLPNDIDNTDMQAIARLALAQTNKAAYDAESGATQEGIYNMLRDRYLSGVDVAAGEEEVHDIKHNLYYDFSEEAEEHNYKPADGVNVFAGDRFGDSKLKLAIQLGIVTDADLHKVNDQYWAKKNEIADHSAKLQGSIAEAKNNLLASVPPELLAKDSATLASTIKQKFGEMDGVGKLVTMVGAGVAVWLLARNLWRKDTSATTKWISGGALGAIALYGLGGKDLVKGTPAGDMLDNLGAGVNGMFNKDKQPTTTPPETLINDQQAMNQFINGLSYSLHTSEAGEICMQDMMEAYGLAAMPIGLLGFSPNEDYTGGSVTTPNNIPDETLLSWGIDPNHMPHIAEHDDSWGPAMAHMYYQLAVSKGGDLGYYNHRKAQELRGDMTMGENAEGGFNALKGTPGHKFYQANVKLGMQLAASPQFANMNMMEIFGNIDDIHHQQNPESSTPDPSTATKKVLDKLIFAGGVAGTPRNTAYSYIELEEGFRLMRDLSNDEQARYIREIKAVVATTGLQKLQISTNVDNFNTTADILRTFNVAEVIIANNDPANAMQAVNKANTVTSLRIDHPTITADVYSSLINNNTIETLELRGVTRKEQLPENSLRRILRMTKLTNLKLPDLKTITEDDFNAIVAAKKAGKTIETTPDPSEVRTLMNRWWIATPFRAAWNLTGGLLGGTLLDNHYKGGWWNEPL